MKANLNNAADSRVLRLLDANANRAREAMRVLEDYARFVLNDAGLSGQLKQLRHELTTITRTFGPEAILHRDTGADVGTAIKLQSELDRGSIADVVTAAGKRLGEAIRAMEEFSKITSIVNAVALEKLRYRFYELEQAVARTLRLNHRFENVRLYVLITESCCRLPWLETARAAIAGGADALQLREKNLESGELLRRARVLATLCREKGALLIINDRPDIAVLSDADGVHVGQGDLPAVEARRIVGPGRIVGVSTHEIGQARQAVLDGADYIGVGPVFRSETKPRDMPEIPGLDYAREVVAAVSIPAIAIAGINSQNIDSVLKSGIRAVAVTAAVTDCAEVETAARALSRKMQA